MKQFHFYHKTTGVILGYSICINAPDDDGRTLARNCPPDHNPIQGHLHHLRHRVNVVTGEVIDVPQEFDQKSEDKTLVKQKIEALERPTMRLMREAMLGDLDAQRKLTDINKQIEDLRKELK